MTSPSDKLVEHLRLLLWSQWTELGVAGTIRNHQLVLLDPEALILLTAALADLDPRLRDESLDWCIRFGETISISRLRNLMRAGVGDAASFDAYATEVNRAGRLKWPVSKKLVSRRAKGRGKFVASGKSQAPDLLRPALLRLRLRAIFGVGARADVLTELLLSSRKSASELAKIGYSKRRVASTLDDLTRGGLLSRTEHGNTHRFELREPEHLETLVGTLPPYRAHWGDCFRVLLELHALVVGQTGKSQRLGALAMNRSISKLCSELERLRWGVPVSATADDLWEQGVQWTLDRVERSAKGPPDERNVSSRATF